MVFGGGYSLGEFGVVRAGELTGGQLDQVRQIHQQAFAPHHRVPFDELIAAGPVDLFLAVVDGGDPVGFGALRMLAAANWTFLRYYAIAADRRGEGIGQRFWTLLQPTVLAAGWPARIAFEVEHPGHAGGRGARDTARARIAFWGRCGCQVLPVTGYVMPDISGHAAPEPMLLMASQPATADLSKGQLADLVLAIYQGRYQLGPDDPMVIAALASIGQS